MPTTITIESFEEFTQRHGGEPVELQHRFLFPDGAQADLLGEQRREPPTDPIAALRMTRMYWAERSKQAEQAFFSFRGRVNQQLSFASENPDLPMPGPDAVEHLKHLRDEAQRLAATVAAIDARLAETPYGKRRLAEIERENARQAEISQLAAAMAEVRLDGVPEPKEPINPMLVAAVQQEQRIFDRAFAQKLGIRD